MKSNENAQLALIATLRKQMHATRDALDLDAHMLHDTTANVPAKSEELQQHHLQAPGTHTRTAPHSGRVKLGSGVPPARVSAPLPASAENDSGERSVGGLTLDDMDADADGIVSLRQELEAVRAQLKNTAEGAAQMQHDIEDKNRQLQEQRDARAASEAFLAQGENALKAEQAARAATVEELEAAKAQMEAETVSLASTKQELLAADACRDALEKELETCIEQVKSLEANAEELTSTAMQLQSELRTEKKAHQHTGDAGKDLEKKVTALEQHVASLQQELQDSQKAADDARASLGSETSHLSDTLDEARSELRDLTLERDALKDKAQELSEARSGLEGQLRTQQAANTAVAESLNQAQEALKACESEAKLAADKMASLQEEMAALTQKLIAETTARTAADGKIAALERDAAAAQMELEETRETAAKSIRQLEMSSEALQAELRDLQLKCSELDAEKSSLTATLVDLQHQASELGREMVDLQEGFARESEEGQMVRVQRDAKQARLNVNMQAQMREASSAAEEIDRQKAQVATLERNMAALQSELDGVRGAAEGTRASLEAAESHEIKEIAQLRSALVAETSAKDAANSRAEELEKSLSAETEVRTAAVSRVAMLEKEAAAAQTELGNAHKAAEELDVKMQAQLREASSAAEEIDRQEAQVATLERNMAALQSELDDARRIVDAMRGSLGGVTMALSAALEKACAEGRTLAQERDALSGTVESLKQELDEQKAATLREVKGLKDVVACMEADLTRKVVSELDVMVDENAAAASDKEIARLQGLVEQWSKTAVDKGREANSLKEQLETILREKQREGQEAQQLRIKLDQRESVKALLKESEAIQASQMKETFAEQQKRVERRHQQELSRVKRDYAFELEAASLEIRKLQGHVKQLEERIEHLKSKVKATEAASSRQTVTHLPRSTLFQSFVPLAGTSSPTSWLHSLQLPWTVTSQEASSEAKLPLTTPRSAPASPRPSSEEQSGGGRLFLDLPVCSFPQGGLQYGPEAVQTPRRSVEREPSAATAKRDSIAPPALEGIVERECDREERECDREMTDEDETWPLDIADSLPSSADSPGGGAGPPWAMAEFVDFADPLHLASFPPTEGRVHDSAEPLAQHQSGAKGYIGLELSRFHDSRKDGGLRVFVMGVDVVKDANGVPQGTAGYSNPRVIRQGDEVLQVQGLPVSSMAPDTLLNTLSGEADTTVDVTFRAREGEEGADESVADDGRTYTCKLLRHVVALCGAPESVLTEGGGDLFSASWIGLLGGQLDKKALSSDSVRSAFKAVQLELVREVSAPWMLACILRVLCMHTGGACQRVVWHALLCVRPYNDVLCIYIFRQHVCAWVHTCMKNTYVYVHMYKSVLQQRRHAASRQAVDETNTKFEQLLVAYNELRRLVPFCIERRRKGREGKEKGGRG